MALELAEMCLGETWSACHHLSAARSKTRRRSTQTFVRGVSPDPPVSNATPAAESGTQPSCLVRGRGTHGKIGCFSSLSSYHNYRLSNAFQRPAGTAQLFGPRAPQYIVDDLAPPLRRRPAHDAHLPYPRRNPLELVRAVSGWVCNRQVHPSAWKSPVGYPARPG